MTIINTFKNMISAVTTCAAARRPKMIQRKEKTQAKKKKQSFIPQTVNMMNYINTFQY